MRKQIEMLSRRVKLIPKPRADGPLTDDEMMQAAQDTVYLIESQAQPGRLSRVPVQREDGEFHAPTFEEAVDSVLAMYDSSREGYARAKAYIAEHSERH